MERRLYPRVYPANVETHLARCGRDVTQGGRREQLRDVRGGRGRGQGDGDGEAGNSRHRASTQAREEHTLVTPAHVHPAELQRLVEGNHSGHQDREEVSNHLTVLYI